MKKKICFVVSSPLTVKAFLANHIKTLADYYDIYLVVKLEDGSSDMISGLPIQEVKHIEISRSIHLLKDLKALYNLRSYFKKNKFDAVHTVTPKAGLLGILGARLGGIRKRIHIFTGQVWYTKKGLLKLLLMFLDRCIVWNATHILVDGETQRQFLISNSIVKSSNSFVLGKGSISGVDVNKFVPSVDQRRRVRAELNILEDEVVYMFIGRMNIDKGIRELANAFDRLSKKFANVRLLLVGGDEENMTTYIQEQVTNLDKVIFYGLTPKPEHILQACDVFCLPSYREGFGTSVIEASLMEKPIICSDTYGLMETIIEGKTGLRHKVGDVESLYLQMEKLVNDNELRNELGMGGRAYVLDNFSGQLISGKWLSFYSVNV